MLPGNDIPVTNRRADAQKKRWYKPVRCSICLNFIWLQPVMLHEPVEAPIPHHSWVLCKRCNDALRVEMNRSELRTSLRLRIAVGLVAAERSPQAYPANTQASEQQTFQREFAWVMWSLIFFALLHLVILGLILTVPR